MNLPPRPDPMLKRHAEAIARDAAPLVGFDPITLAIILYYILSTLIQCWRIGLWTTDPREALVQACSSKRGRSRIRFRIAARCVRENEENPITYSQAYRLADTILEHALRDDNSENLKKMYDQAGPSS